MEAHAIFLNPFTVCSTCKRRFVVCSFVDEETNGSYPFRNGLNGLARLYLRYITFIQENKEEDAKSPNMCVFLHGALKVENMCGLVQVFFTFKSCLGLGRHWFWRSVLISAVVRDYKRSWLVSTVKS
jgi:hypothetical protein